MITALKKSRVEIEELFEQETIDVAILLGLIMYVCFLVAYRSIKKVTRLTSALVIVSTCSGLCLRSLIQRGTPGVFIHDQVTEKNIYEPLGISCTWLSPSSG